MKNCWRAIKWLNGSFSQNNVSLSDRNKVSKLQNWKVGKRWKNITGFSCLYQIIFTILFSILFKSDIAILNKTGAPDVFSISDLEDTLTALGQSLFSVCRLSDPLIFSNCRKWLGIRQIRWLVGMLPQLMRWGWVSIGFGDNITPYFPAESKVSDAYSYLYPNRDVKLPADYMNCGGQKNLKWI